jgi:hypothetical protein
MKKEQTDCSETLVFKLQTPGNNPEHSISQILIGYCGYAAKRNNGIIGKTVVPLFSFVATYHKGDKIK